MTTTLTKRLLPPSFRPSMLPRGFPFHISRHASSTSTPGPKTLAQPTKYNPPSHPPTLRRESPQSYPTPRPNTGPNSHTNPRPNPRPNSRKNKRYPGTEPARGTFLYWFLSNRYLHMWITLTILFIAAAYTFVRDFRHTTAFLHMLPSWGEFGRHPWESGRRFLEVYRLHVAHVTETTMERRRAIVDDVAKRSRYRTAKGVPEVGLAAWAEKWEKGVDKGEGEGDEEGKRRRRPVKMWFGIW